MTVTDLDPDPTPAPVELLVLGPPLSEDEVDGVLHGLTCGARVPARGVRPNGKVRRGKVRCGKPVAVVFVSRKSEAVLTRSGACTEHAGALRAMVRGAGGRVEGEDS